MTEIPISLGTRLGSMIFDHFIMTIILMIFLSPLLINNFTDSRIKAVGNSSMIEMNSPVTYFMIFGFALYFCKDIFGGRSIAKRILKLQVVSNSTGEVASPIQCVIRNFFCVIWPLEVIMTLINPSRRLGDIIAGTKIISQNPPITKEINLNQIVISFILAYGITSLIFYII